MRNRALRQHLVKSGHIIDSKPLIDQISLLDTGFRDWHRNMLESIHIKLRGATVNCNDGYQLPDIYIWMLHKEARGGLLVTPALPLVRR